MHDYFQLYGCLLSPKPESVVNKGGVGPDTDDFMSKALPVHIIQLGRLSLYMLRCAAHVTIRI